MLLKKAAGGQSGSKRPNTEKVGKVTRKQLEEIAKAKEPDLIEAELNEAVSTIAGSARWMGRAVGGCEHGSDNATERPHGCRRPGHDQHDILSGEDHTVQQHGHMLRKRTR